jgi:hypothetical protein
MVRLTQTELQTCTDANIVSKQIETRFDMTHVTSEFHRVPPILFLSLWYVRRKLWSIHAEPSFHLSLITKEYPRVHPKRFVSRWYVRCKLCSYLALTLSPNVLKQDSTRPTSLTSSIGCVQSYIYDVLVRSMQTVHLSCVKICTIYKWTEQSSTRPSSPRSTIGCV